MRTFLRARVFAVAASALFAAAAAFAQAAVDPGLEQLIASIRAIDNHAHPTRCVSPGEPADDEVDQIPVDAFAEFLLPPGLDPNNPALREAWRALYDWTPEQAAAATEADVVAARERIQREQGDGYGNWVLDRMGVETMLANRIATGRCLAAPRFRWVSFVDALIFPLRNDALYALNPDTRGAMPGVERLLRRYLKEAGVAELPKDLPTYLSRVVTPTLERQRKAGALAVKFEAAYLRPLDFADVPQREAERVYARYVTGGPAPASEYRALQDFLFRYIAREAGRLGLAVHLHVLGTGAGSYYAGKGSEPWLLEPVFNDAALRKTRFVLVHGGWPWTDAVGMLFYKPNVYADFSAQVFLLPPAALAGVLRGWLAQRPERVLFGTDAFPVTPSVGWEETGWLEARNARRALGLALTGMLRDGEVDRLRAEQLARMVLRENAERLYSLAGAAPPAP